MNNQLKPKGRITLHWMNSIRKRLDDKKIDLSDPEWKFIEPIFMSGMAQEEYINRGFEKNGY